MTPATTLSSTGPTAGILPDRRRTLALAAVFALMLLLVPLATANRASAQIIPQGVGLGVTPIYPSLVIVGQTGVAAQLSILNNSAGVGPVTLTEITLNPSCLDLLCATPDLGVLQLSPTGLGVAGVCNGVSFTITPGVDGDFIFTPAAPVVLTPPSILDDLDTCLINYSFNVLKAPVLDAAASARPADPRLRHRFGWRPDHPRRAPGGHRHRGRRSRRSDCGRRRSAPGRRERSPSASRSATPPPSPELSTRRAR